MYKVNGNSVWADWTHMAAAYGKGAYQAANVPSMTDDEKANTLKSELNQGRYPIVHVPAGHYFVIVSYSPLPGGVAPAAETTTPDVKWEPATPVTPADISPMDTSVKSKDKGSISPQIIPSGYDGAFIIYDPYITSSGLGGPNRRFYDNIKGASFSSIDQIIVIR